jgi:hypothetical protein
MDDFENELRRAIADRAESLPDKYEAPPSVVARVRRRRAVKRGALALSIVLVVSGSVAAVAGVAGRDDAKRVISTEPVGPTTTVVATTTSRRPRSARAVETMKCPVLESLRSDRPPNPPVIVPRVPAAGDETTYRDLASYASAADQRHVVLGPKTWSCLAQVAADGGDSMVVYPPAATPGRVPPVAQAPIAVGNDYLWHGAFPTPCQVSHAPDVLAHAAHVGIACALPAGRTLTRVDGDVSEFVDAGGARGAAWLKLPTSEDGVDGLIGVITCQPTQGLTAADCDTIIADWAARVAAVRR